MNKLPFMNKFFGRNINTSLRKFDMSANEDPNHIQKSYRKICTSIERRSYRIYW
jgi:hypothetical protein